MGDTLSRFHSLIEGLGLATAQDERVRTGRRAFVRIQAVMTDFLVFNPDTARRLSGDRVA
jgi:hypothetical protein